MTPKKWYEGLKRGDQATHIYRSEAEQLRVVTDLIAWMSEGEKLVLMTDRWESEQDMPSSRILEAAIEDGRFEVIPVRGSLMASTGFRAEAMADAVYSQHYRAIEEGMSGLTFVWELDWASRSQADFEAFLQYQSKMMISTLPRDLTVMSQYSLTSLTQQQVEQILRVSPLVLEDGQLDRNFWVVSTTTMGRPSRDDRLGVRGTEKQKSSLS